MSGEEEASELRKRLVAMQSELEQRTKEVVALAKANAELGVAYVDATAIIFGCPACGEDHRMVLVTKLTTRYVGKKLKHWHQAFVCPESAKSVLFSGDEELEVAGEW